MGNLIPWSQIHPSIKSEGPFVAVVIVDPQRQLCVSEMVEFDPELIADVNQAVPEVVAAAQAAAARVVSGYRSGRRAVAALVTVQLIAWLLLLIVLFLMVTRPF